MALSRVILLLAVGAQVLLVSTQEGPRVVHLTQRGQAHPEDRRYHDGKSPQSAEVSSETDRDDRRNISSSSSSSQQLVPQIEIVYDSTGKGWVDKVKQVPDPASAPSREARRADVPRKDIIGTEIINDVAYLEIRDDKGQKSPPLVTIKRVEDNSTTAAVSTTATSSTTAADSDIAHKGKIHYSQIPFREAPTLSTPASEKIRDNSRVDQVGVSTTTTTTTETPTTTTSTESDENDEGAETATQEQEPDGAEIEDEDEDLPDYSDDSVSSEDQAEHNVTSEYSSSDSLSSTTPSTTEIENDYEADHDDDDEDEEHETETDATESPAEPATETTRATVPPEPEFVEPQTSSTPPETSTMRRIPVSQITTPSVSFVMPTEPVMIPEETPEETVTESFDGEDADDGQPQSHQTEDAHDEVTSSEELSAHNSTNKVEPDQSSQSAPESGESSGEPETDEFLTTTLAPGADEMRTETIPTGTTAASTIETITSTSVVFNTPEATSEEPTTKPGANIPKTSTSSSEIHTSNEPTVETTTSHEGLGREIEDDSFPTEKSRPTPDIFSQFVTVNPNMLYGIIRTSSSSQPVSDTTEASAQTSSARSTSTSSTMTKPPTTTTSTTATPPTTKAGPPSTTTTATPAAPGPIDSGFVLGLEGLFNFSPAGTPKTSEAVRPSVARFGNSFETLKQSEASTKAPAALSSTSIPSFFGDGAPLEMLNFPWSTDENEFSGQDASVLRNQPKTATTTVAAPTPISSTTPVSTVTVPSRVNLFSKKIAPTLVPTRPPPSGPTKKFNLFASLTNTNSATGHKTDWRPELRPLKKVSGPWEPSIEPPEDDVPHERATENSAPLERNAFFGKPVFDRRLVLESLPPSTTTRRPAPKFHPPTLLHDFAVAPPVDHRHYDMDDILHRGTPATPRNAKTPISMKARTTLLMCAAIIGGAAIFFATLMVVCMRRTKNKRLIRRRAIDKFIQDSTSEASSSYGGSHSSYGRKGLLARV